MVSTSRAVGCVLLLGLAACDCGGSGDADSGADARPPGDAAVDGAVDGSVTPIPGEGECAWEVGERPTAELPPEHTNRYEIELERWAIDADSGDPVETRQRINEAIQWAVDTDFDLVVLPPGRYLVGENTNDVYAAGIELPGDMTFELAEGAVIEMATNDRANYCVIDLGSNTDITVRGGEIVGDRATHDFSSGGAHSEGHAICAWTSVERVLIEDMELHEVTGDGVLIVGRRASDEAAEIPSRHITIRNNNIHHNRRQGVSVVGAHNVVIENNRIHHIEGSEPQFGIDIEGAGRTDRDILIFENIFHHNAGGDIVTSTGRNTWIEDNTMAQCQVDDFGVYDAELPCELEEQIDGPIVLWKETDNVVRGNTIRMSMRTVNGFWGIIGYTRRDGPTRENPVGNLFEDNTFENAGIHFAYNSRTVLSRNTIRNGLFLGFNLACTRLNDNRIDRVDRENYKLRNVAGTASGNVLNRSEGALPEEDREMHFPMADDAPYRNSSPVFW